LNCGGGGLNLNPTHTKNLFFVCMKILNPRLSFWYKVEGQIMPVGKDEWNAGRKWESIQARILAFLKTNRDKGFTADEIHNGLGFKTGSGFWEIMAKIANMLTIQNALEALVKEGSVKAKIVKETVDEFTYYMVA